MGDKHLRSRDGWWATCALRRKVGDGRRRWAGWEKNDAERLSVTMKIHTHWYRLRMAASHAAAASRGRSQPVVGEP